MSDESTAADVFDFLVEYREDARAGAVRSLAEYLRRYPRNADAVARAYLAEQEVTGDAESSAPDAAAIDERRLGPFRLLRELGSGGQGQVWLAEDTRLERRVALKLFPRGIVTDARRARIRREAEAVARLAHPGLCTIHEAELDGEAPHLVMQYVEGRDLARTIEARRAGEGGGALPCIPRDVSELRRVLAFFEEAARALHFAHEAGLVHRDVKPGNIMVTPAGRPVLLDFGLARDLNDEERLTLSGETYGTPNYMAPEQVDGAAVDRRTDVYELAVTMYEALTGEVPGSGSSLYEIQRSVRLDPLPDARRLNRCVPRDLVVVLSVAADKDPHRRYVNALAFAEDLARVQRLEPVEVRPVGVGLRLARWARRQPALATALGATILSLTAGFLLTLVLLGQVRSALDRAVGKQFAQRARELVVESPDTALGLGVAALDLIDDEQARSGLYELLEGCELNRVLDAEGTTRFNGFVLAGGVAAAGTTTFEEGALHGEIVLWDFATGALRRRVRVPREPVRSVDVSDDGRTLVAVTDGGTLLGIDVTSGRERFREQLAEDLDEGERAILWAEFAPGGEALAVQRAYGGALILAYPELTETARLATPRLASGVVRWSPDGARLLTASRALAGAPDTAARAVQVWGSDGTLRAARDHAADVTWAAWTAQGDIVTGSHDGNVQILGPDGVPRGAPLPHAGPVYCAALDAEAHGVAVAVGGDEPGACVWDLARRLRHDLGVHDAPVVHVSWSPDGERLATTSHDRTVRLWRTSDRQLEKTCRLVMRPLESRWSPDGREVVTTTLGYRTFVWNAGAMPYVYRIAHGAPVRWAGFLATAQRGWSASADGSLRVFDTPRGDDPRAGWSSGRGLLHVVAGAEPLVDVDVDERSARALVLNVRGAATVWDLDSGARACTITASTAFVRARLAPGGERAALVSGDGRLWLAQLEPGECAANEVASARVRPATVAFAPDGVLLACEVAADLSESPGVQASVGESAAVELRDARTGEVTARFELPGARGVLELAWHPAGGELGALDGREVLYTWTRDGAPLCAGVKLRARRFRWGPGDRRTVLAWDDEHAGGKRMALYDLDQPDAPALRPRGIPPGKYTAVDFDPGGRWFAASSADGVVHVWDARDCRLDVRYAQHAGPVRVVRFTPDGRVLTAGDDGSARMWPADPRSAARARAPRLLSAEELARERARMLGGDE